VAISGFKTDGNKFINEAIDNGASIVFTDKKLDTTILSRKAVPIIQVDDARSYLAYLTAEYYNYPSKQLNLIGVTGTNGKTTTTHLIYNLLNYHGKSDKNYKKNAGLIGTVHVDTGKGVMPGNLTTPDPITLQEYLRAMVDNDLKYACMEVSSHGIKLKRIIGNKFAVKVGTNISADHFDLHPNFDDYLQVKKGFLEGKEEALVLLNNDNKFLHSFGQIAENQYNFGINGSSDIIAKDIKN
ncbi:MAG: Mur ligase family protein, partial [Halanaerobiales bacterium]